MYLTTSNIVNLLNTGNEITATCLSSNLQEIFLGVGTTAYMYKNDAKELLSFAAFEGACSHPESKNALFVHLDDATLLSLLEAENFYIAEA